MNEYSDFPIQLQYCNSLFIINQFHIKQHFQENIKLFRRNGYLSQAHQIQKPIPKLWIQFLIYFLDRLEQYLDTSIVCVFVKNKILESSWFVVSELVVGSGEQEATSHYF